MEAFLIWSAWFVTGSAIFFVLPFLPLPRVFTSGTKVLRVQVTLFAMGWLGKFFAGGLYFAAGKTHAIALACASLAALFSVFVIGVIFRRVPTKEEEIAKLRERLAELGETLPSAQVDQKQSSHTPELGSESSSHPVKASLSLADLDGCIRARRGA